MKCVAEIAYVDRRFGKNSYVSPVPRHDLPVGTQVGDVQDLEYICVCGDIKRRNGRNEELVFKTDDSVESIYWEKYDETSQGNYDLSHYCWTKKELSDTENVFVMPQSFDIYFASYIGETQLHIKRNGTDNSIVISLRMFFSDTWKMIGPMIDDLAEISEALTHGDISSYVYQNNEQDAQTETVADEGTTQRKRRYLTNPNEILCELDRTGKILENVQIHAETDLCQVYERIPRRKVRHFTPRTLLEYSTTSKPKIHAVTYKEHYDIFEHRVMVQYFRDLQASYRRKQNLHLKSICEYQAMIEQIDSELPDLTISDAIQKITNTREEICALIAEEERTVKDWEEPIRRIDDILSSYPILADCSRGEKLKNTMLFMRNRYYRAMYKRMKKAQVIEAYTNLNAIPCEKVVTIYERWCFFILVKALKEKYGFSLYMYSCEQGLFHEQEERMDFSSLSDIVSAMISDTDQKVPKYMSIVLRKEEHKYVKVEYQRVFNGQRGDAGSLRPDISITFGRKRSVDDECFDINGQIYFLDMKHKFFRNRKEAMEEIFQVAYGKYADKSADEENRIHIDIHDSWGGSFIIHPCGHRRELFNFGRTSYCSDEYYGTRMHKLREIYSGLPEPGFGFSDREIRRFTDGDYENKLGIFFADAREDNNLGLRKLLRMIFELNHPYTQERPYRYTKCLLCGGLLSENTKSTSGQYIKHWATCEECGDFVIFTHCKNKRCNKNFIKHTINHNYFKQSINNNGKWSIRCPYCGQGF